MRKTICFTIILVLFSSCEDYFEHTPQGNPTDEKFYQNLNELQIGLNAVYSILADNNFQKSEWLFGDGCGDDCTLTDGVNPSSHLGQVGLFTFSSDNDMIRTRWQINYTGIFRANWIILNAPGTYQWPGLGGANQNVLREIICQAKFLRALFYFNLVKTYGGVPIKPEKLEITADGTDNFVQPRSSLTEVYQYIEKDLRESILGLRESYIEEEFGHITKGAATGLLIKVLAYQGKPGIQHPKWDEVVSMGSAFINQENMSIRELLDFDNLYPDESPEEIAERLGFRNSLNLDSLIMVAGKYNLSTAYDELWNLSGEFSESSLIEVNHVNTPNIDRNFGSWFSEELNSRNYPHADIIQPSQNLLDLKGSSNDPRLFTTVLEQPGFVPDNTSIGGQAGPTYTSCYKWYTLRYERQLQAGNPKNFRMLRFADIILYYAEALNETGDPVAAIDEANKLRYRARQIAVSGRWTAIPSGPDDIPYGNYLQVRDRIWKERRIEKACEFDRFWDIVRTGQAAERLAEFNQKMGLDRYKKHFVKGVNEIFPIPQVEIDLSNGIVTQNPGY